MNINEDNLIEKVKKGQVEAFGELMELHMRRIRAFIALNAPFVYAYRHIEDFETGTSFFSWVRAIAWNLLRSETQRYSREQSSRAGYSTFQLLQMSADKSENERDLELDYLEDCLRQVPGKQRTLLDMKYTMNSSSDEIARTLKKTREWVRTNLFRIRQNLKDCIEAKISRG
ncbi:RNA polymerase sigma factor [Planctomycetota bacterium]